MTSISRLVSYFPPKEKVKIGHLTGLYFLYKNLVEMGVDVHVLTSGYPFQKRYENVDGIHVHRVLGGGSGFMRYQLVLYNLSILHRIPKLVKKYDIDIIHGHEFDPFLYALKRRGDKVPFILTSHHTLRGWMKDISSEIQKFSVSKLKRAQRFLEYGEDYLFEKICFENADLILALSKSHKKEICVNYNISPEKVCYVYNGVDPDIFNPEVKGGKIREKYRIKDSPIVLYVGSLGIRKGTRYLIEAAKLVCDERPDVKFMLVGGDEKDVDYFSKVSKEIGVKPNVIFTRAVPFFDLPQYYSACDVFAFPTLHDCFGKVLVEAMACEKPVVATRVCGVPEIVEEGETGLLVESKNSQDLATNILRLIDDLTLARKMGIKGRERVEKMFTWERAAKENIKVYDMLL
ncbi:MAG: glycosyltransferase family 4 protein [Methanocellales archaeon]|nr:glycosyltransferase family 4 protein [Methanocellales archaeon]